MTVLDFHVSETLMSISSNDIRYGGNASEHGITSADVNEQGVWDDLW